MLWLTAGLALAQGRGAEVAALAVSQPAAQVQQTILRAIRQIPADQPERRRYRQAFPFGAPLFPSDADLAAATTTPELAQWLGLPPPERSRDVLIVPDIDYFWTPGDVEQGGFSCQFIVHLQPLVDDQTRLSLVQVQPTVYLGKKFHLLGRTGPGRYLDIRPARPSARASAELLDFLALALAQPQ